MPEYLQQIWSELCAAHATLCQYNRVMSVSLHTERRLRGQSIEPTLELEHAPTPSFDRQDQPKPGHTVPCGLHGWQSRRRGRQCSEAPTSEAVMEAEILCAVSLPGDPDTSARKRVTPQLVS